MNIAFLTKGFRKGEVDAAISTIIEAAHELKRKGHEVIIISDRAYSSEDSYALLPKHEIVEGIEVWRPHHLKTKFLGMTVLPVLFFSMMTLPGLAVQYVEKKKNISFDIVHSFSGSHFFMLNHFFVRSKNKFIKHIHTVKAKSYYSKRWWQIGSNAYAFLLNRADHITVPLKSMKKELQEHYVKKPISIVHSFIDLKRFRKRATKTSLRRKYGLPRYKKIVLYYGHLLPNKGGQDLIKVFKEIGKERRDIMLLLLHPTYPNKKDEQLIKDCTINGSIVLKKGKADIPEYLHAVDMVALPYKNLRGTEANPLCILETLASQTPLITTTLPELQEMVPSKENVVWIEPGNHEQLKKAIIAAGNKKIKATKQKVLHEFDVSYCIGLLEKIYRE